MSVEVEALKGFEVSVEVYAIGVEVSLGTEEVSVNGIAVNMQLFETSL